MRNRAGIATIVPNEVGAVESCDSQASRVDPERAIPFDHILLRASLSWISFKVDHVSSLRADVHSEDTVVANPARRKEHGRAPLHLHAIPSAVLDVDIVEIHLGGVEHQDPITAARDVEPLDGNAVSGAN